MSQALKAHKGSVTRLKAMVIHGHIISRVAAALFGGYALAHTASIALFGALPMARGEAAMAAIQLSFAVYAAAVIWVFAARSARAAWIGILVPTGFTGLIAWMVV